MRVPKSPEPSTLRQVEPEIQKGEFETRVNPEAFGGVSQSNIEKEGETATLETRLQDSMDSYQVNKAKAAWLTKAKDFLPTALDTKGQNAQQYSPDKADGPVSEFVKPTREQVMGMAKNGRQQRMLEPWVDRQIADMDGTLKTHVLKETTLDAGKTYTDNINNIISLARNYRTPDAIQSALKDGYDQTKGLVEWGGAQGNIATHMQSFKNRFDTAMVDSYRAEGDVQGLKNYMATMGKTGIRPALEAKATALITKDDALTFYKKNSILYKDQEGFVNTEPMHNAINGNNNFTETQKKTYNDIIDAQAGKNAKELNTQITSRWDNFGNTFAKALKANMPYSKMLDIPAQIGGSAREQQRMTDAINARFNATEGFTINIGGKKNATFQKMHENLYEAIQDGYLTKVSDIGELYDKGVLNKDQYTDALKFFDAATKGGASKDVSMARAQVRRMAEDVLPTEDVSPFMTNYMQGTAGKTPSDSIKWAKENLEPETKDPSHYWNQINGLKDSWLGNREEEPTLESDKLMKSLTAEVGRGQMASVMTAFKKQGIEHPTPDDFAKFLQDLGNVGLADIRRGTPINNAMISIENWNKMNPGQTIPFNAQAIKALSEKYPHGYF